MKIKSIYIRAFRCFEEADIDFAKMALVLI